MHSFAARFALAAALLGRNAFVPVVAGGSGACCTPVTGSGSTALEICEDGVTQANCALFTDSEYGGDDSTCSPTQCSGATLGRCYFEASDECRDFAYFTKNSCENVFSGTHCGVGSTDCTNCAVQYLLNIMIDEFLDIEMLTKAEKKALDLLKKKDLQDAIDDVNKAIEHIQSDPSEPADAIKDLLKGYKEIKCDEEKLPVPRSKIEICNGIAELISVFADDLATP